MYVIEQTLIKYLEHRYSGDTHVRGSGYGWFYRTCRDNEGSPLVKTIKRELPERLNCRISVTHILCLLNNMIQDFDQPEHDEMRKDFNKLIPFVTTHRDRCPHPVPNKKLCTEEEFKSFLKELSGIQVILAKLFYYGQLKLADLGDDTYKLSKLSEGVVNVRAMSKRTRYLESADRWTLTDAECNEVIPVLEGFAADIGDKARKLTDRLSEYTHGWKFMSGHLRTSRAIHLLVNGATQEDVAYQQGCVKTQLIKRIEEYVEVNPTHPLSIAWKELKQSRK